MRTEIRPPAAPSMAAPKSHRATLVGSSVAAVWVAVGLASLMTPDLVTGSAQEHLPLAAITFWMWGAVATGLILMAAGIAGDVADTRWRTLAIAVVTIWSVVAIVSIMAPELVTGSDPTRLPIAALVAPVAGMIATAFTCVYVAGAKTR
jgi:hypothetical protein